MRVLVTGGAGFIGSHLVDRLLPAEDIEEVVVLDNLHAGSMKNLVDAQLNPYGKLRLRVIEGDIRNQMVCLDAMAGIDVVVHLAALNRAMKSFQDANAFIDVNIAGTANLLEAAFRKNIHRFIFASSSSVYGGTSVKKSMLESTPMNPCSPYGVSKLTGENLCRVMSMKEKLQCVALRFFSVFGSRQAGDNAYSAVIPKMIRAAVEGGTFCVYGDGEQSRDFTYVDNVTMAIHRAIFASLPKMYSVFNVATSHPVTVNRIVALVKSHLGEFDVRHIQENPAEFRHSLADISDMKLFLDIKEEELWSFEKGLRSMIVSKVGTDG